MLPGRRTGVVALVTAPGASAATDLIAALVYDLEAGRPTARATSTEQLNALISRVADARRRRAVDDSTRRSNPQRLRRPIRDYVGTYESPGYGEVTISTTGDALRFRWGVLRGPLQLVNAEADEFEIDIAASANRVSFHFDGMEPARSLSLANVAFQRK